MHGDLLETDFYQQEDVVDLARQLLGKVLVTRFQGQVTAGRIVETEAYRGRDDKACHAHGKRTARTEVMYRAGGVAYIYLCYGIHHLFNIVTNKENVADAVLIRAIEPMEGIEVMLARRNMKKFNRRITAGPGTLSQALSIHKKYTGIDLTGDLINIYDDCHQVPKNKIVETTRIGVDYAEEDALRPWRFYIEDNSFVSKKIKK